MNLTDFRALGRSGLIVSPFASGTMTFGTGRWGSDETVSKDIFNHYTETGGNFIDTADVYAKGRSEELIGEFVAERNLRDRLVLGTKFTWNLEHGNPNAGGNGRKNIYRALENSRRRLKTNYIDLYWLHFWDMVTPPEEVLQTMTDLVRAGKIRYYALSDVPAWYLTKMATLAAERGLPAPVALQMEYSLVERTIEREHIPAAREDGIGIVSWSPLAGGYLSSKYQEKEKNDGGENRLSGANLFGQTKFTTRNWRILDELRRVAAEAERTPAEVALAWTMTRPNISALIIGASKLDQLKSNLAGLEIELSSAQIAALNQSGEPEAAFPYAAFGAEIRRSIFGGADVEKWRA